jgi:hypothetical protein
MPDCWQSSYLRFIRDQEKLNRSVLASQEILSNLPERLGAGHGGEFLNDLAVSLGPRWHIVIIVTYRRWFEWVISYYHLLLPTSQQGSQLPTKTH